MRRSSRIRAKKRVNYNEDAMFYKAIGKTKSAWNQLVEVAADDPPPAQKPWQKRALFRPKPPPSCWL